MCREKTVGLMMQLNALRRIILQSAVAAELTCCAESIILVFLKTAAGREIKHKAESHVHSRSSECIPEKEKTTSSLEYRVKVHKAHAIHRHMQFTTPQAQSIQRLAAGCSVCSCHVAETEQRYFVVL